MWHCWKRVSSDMEIQLVKGSRSGFDLFLVPLRPEFPSVYSDLTPDVSFHILRSAGAWQGVCVGVRCHWQPEEAPGDSGVNCSKKISWAE